MPIAKLISEVIENPFIPLHWGAAQSGMQAFSECDKRIGGLSREEAWLAARDYAVSYAEEFAKAGYAKQLVNRLLEPFAWSHVLVTATDWANFFALRDHKDAEPHIAILAREVKKAMDASEPQLLQPGEWHLPFISSADRKMITNYSRGKEDALATLRKISAARCARISYAPFDGNGSIEKELERYWLLIESDPMHASPVEHQATPDTKSLQRVQIQRDGDPDGYWETVREGLDWDNPHLHGNFRGFIQFRKTLPNEARW